MAIVLDWKIKNRSGVCDHTEHLFEEDEPFYTCIFDDPESDGFIRRDYSLAAWEELSGHMEPEPFSFWRSVYKPPAETGEDETVNQNSAEAILHRLIEQDDPSTENARYILALMLERKKILLPTETKTTDTSTLLFYEHKETGAVYIVADPELKLDEIGHVQEQVSALLEAEENRQNQPPEAAATDLEPGDSPDQGDSADSADTE